MFGKKEWILFFAGAEAFHTLSHILISFTDTLPVKFYSIEWTQQLNMYGIVINALVTVALLWWYAKTK